MADGCPFSFPDCKKSNLLAAGNATPRTHQCRTAHRFFKKFERLKFYNHGRKSDWVNSQGQKTAAGAKREKREGRQSAEGEKSEEAEIAETEKAGTGAGGKLRRAEKKVRGENCKRQRAQGRRRETSRPKSERDCEGRETANGPGAAPIPVEAAMGPPAVFALRRYLRFPSFKFPAFSAGVLHLVQFSPPTVFCYPQFPARHSFRHLPFPAVSSVDHFLPWTTLPPLRAFRPPSF